METFRRAIGILFACLVFAGLIWAARSFDGAANDVNQARADEERAWRARKKSLQVFADDLKERERKQQRQAEIERLENQPPKIADKPPFPRLEVDANPFDLGTIPVGKPGSHKFKIKNVGQAPLVIFRPHYGCQWSRPVVPPRQEIPPGASVEIEFTFTLREATPCFAKTITVWTNDPLHRELVLESHGTTHDRKTR